jgi:hypothetical protein
MRKIFNLEKDGKHSYYGSLQAVFNANKDLGVSKGTLDRFDWSKGDYVNDVIKLRLGVLLSAREAVS